MQAKTESLTMPVRYLKGVGPKNQENLARLEIRTAFDALYYLPSRYEDRSQFSSISEAKVGESQTIQGEVITLNSRYTRRGMPIFQMALGDKSGVIHATWFNQPFLKNYFKAGQRVVLYGRVEKYDRIQIVQPEYEVLKGDETDSMHIGRIVPVYPLTSQIRQRYLRSLIAGVVAKFSRSLVDRLPTYIRARQKLVDIRFAVENIHFPKSFDNLDKAYRRIVFEEFFSLQLAMAIKKRDIKVKEKGISHKTEGELIESFKKAIPFELTQGQKDAIRDIEKDMKSTRPMNRLLVGDVASGKTLVAAHAIVLTVQNGLQGVMMAPTEVLARQHYITLSELLMPLGVNISLLIKGIDPKRKAEIYSEMREGAIDIVVGTHAIIQEGLEFKSLGLAVIDEQHKFGVSQRALLRQKGYAPHVLVMTATPIPRTLALTVYGDLDVSTIRELPKGRRAITTYWIEEEKRDEAHSFIKEELDRGRQAYIVCPLIEESETIMSRSAKEMYEYLSSQVFSSYKVGLLHGKMSTKDKKGVMKQFKKGKIDVLVSTVVIEVGIDVPNASVMMVENAERFGLAQLHQLRGRIGRGDYESYCILVANPKTEAAISRLKTIEETIDGFQVAEEDLHMRGPGEIFGTKQHGLPEIRFGDIMKDFDIMEIARKEAFELIAKDPDLSDERHKGLRQNLASRFRGKFDLIKVG